MKNSRNKKISESNEKSIRNKLKLNWIYNEIFNIKLNEEIELNNWNWLKFQVKLRKLWELNQLKKSKQLQKWKKMLKYNF